MKKKFTIYVAFGEEKSDLMEEGELSLKEANRFDFNTKEERKAFIQGIEETIGCMEANWVIKEATEIKKNKIIIRASY